MAKIAICVGHSRICDSGAVSAVGYTEREYNGMVAKLLAIHLQRLHFNTIVFDKYPFTGYGKSMIWLAKQIKDAECSLALELHFNSADDPAANGHEFLHGADSLSGQRAAKCFSDGMLRDFPAFRSRGLLPVTAGMNGRGFLYGTHCPAVILEPFFGSNLTEARFFGGRHSELAQCYAGAVQRYCAS
jgi:N-acetylmuramoyl-L-alanine amidase